MPRLFRTTLIVGTLNILSFALGFAVNMVVAALFGATAIMDAYFVATTVPAYIATIFSAVLAYTFIPFFSEVRVKNTSPWKLVSTFINLTALIIGLISIGGIAFSGSIIRTIAPGLSAESSATAATLMRLYFPVTIFTGINALIASVYYAHEKFIIPLCNQLITPLLTILFLCTSGAALSVKSLIFAQLSSAVIQCIMLFAGLVRNTEFKYRFSFNFYTPEIKQIVAVMAPLLLCDIVSKSVPVFDRYFLSGFSDGAISYVAYAGKISSTMSSIICAVFSVQIFAALSAYTAENKYNEMKQLFTQIIRILLYVSVPLMFAVAFFGEAIVRIIYERGIFTPEATVTVFKLLRIYMLSLPAVAVGVTLAQCFYALKDTKTVMYIGIVEAVLYVGLCVVLIDHLQLHTIPVAYAAYFTFSAILTALILRHKLKAKGVRIIKGFATYAAMSILIFTPLYLLRNTAPTLLNPTFNDFFYIAVGALCYMGASHMLRIPEYKFVVNKISSKFAAYKKTTTDLQA
jgi:putative peptidoglycan lipid II flippase